MVAQMDGLENELINEGVTDEPNSDYHADHSHVSSTMLKRFRQSPRIYEAHYVTKTMPEESKHCFDIGDGVHAFALEPDRFAEEFAISPEGIEDKRLKPWKEWAKEQDPNATLLKHGDAMMIARCVESLRKIPIVNMFLDTDGLVEQSHRWLCTETHMDCKFRPDKIFPKQRCVLDLKTTQSLDDMRFSYDARDYGYDLQQVHYVDGASTLYGGDPADWMFLFAVVETKAPHRSRVYQLSDGDVIVATEDRIALLNEIRERQSINNWAEVDEHEIKTITLPARKRSA